MPDFAKRLPKADPALHHQGRVRRRARRRTSASRRAPATAAATRTSRTSSSCALVEDRDPFPNAKQSANWTCVGLCAHEIRAEGRRDREAPEVDALIFPSQFHPPTQLHPSCQQKLKASHPTPAGSSGPDSWPSSPPASASPSAAASSTTGASEFGFTGAQLGAIGGAGFSGFCFGIIIGGVIVDKIGYGKLVVVALALHVALGIRHLRRDARRRMPTSSCSGACSSSRSPTARSRPWPIRWSPRSIPNNRTHYLNILHASWPAGMILGVVLGWYARRQDSKSTGRSSSPSTSSRPSLYGADVHGTEVPEVRGVGKGPRVRRDVQVGAWGVRVAIPRALQGSLQLACYPRSGRDFPRGARHHQPSHGSPP